jgi:hypothetical protein
LQPLLDREVKRLPAIYRVPLELCALGGRSKKEVAEELGVPEGTVSSRLVRGRELLRKRLASRGLTLLGGVVGLVLVRSATAATGPGALVGPARVSAPLLRATVKAAVAVSAGQTLVAGGVSGSVASLLSAVLRELSVAKLKVAALVLCAVGLVGAAAGFVTRQAFTKTPDNVPEAAVPSAVPEKKEEVPAAQPEDRLPTDLAVVHRFLPHPAHVNEWKMLRDLPEGAVMVNNVAGTGVRVWEPGRTGDAMPWEGVWHLARAFTVAHQGRRREVELPAGLKLNLVATGPLLGAADQVAVRRLVRRGQRLEMEVVYTRTDPVDRDASWRPVVQVPLDLPVGPARLAVAWRQVEAVPDGKARPVPSLAQTVECRVVDRLATSRAVRVGDVEFQAVVEARCVVLSLGYRMQPVGLRITNRGKKDLLFSWPDNGAWRITVRSPDGKTVRRGVSGPPRFGPPVLVAAGRSRTVFTFGWETPVVSTDCKSFRWEGAPPAQRDWSFDRRGAAKYRLSLEMETGPSTAVGADPSWIGKVKTAEVEFQFVEFNDP